MQVNNLDQVKGLGEIQNQFNLFSARLRFAPSRARVSCRSLVSLQAGPSFGNACPR
jgi:hypothetical protein